MTIADHPAVAALWRASGLTDEPEDDCESVAAFLSAPQSTGFVAVRGGTIVGAVLCGTDGRYGYVHHLAVAPDARHAGIGRKLFRACSEHLGTRHVVIMVRDTNETALGFWKREGFQRVDGLGVHYVRTAPRSANPDVNGR